MPRINFMLFLGLLFIPTISITAGSFTTKPSDTPGFSTPNGANGACQCPEQEFSRSLSREFGTTADGMTAIYNKSGKVNIKTWQNTSVKINITIVVHANDQREADRTFDRIKVNFLSTPGYVKAETMIAPVSGWYGNECGYEVNYEVWMPIGNQLDLKNKYGNSWVATMKGKLMAEIKYGELRTEQVANDADLNISNGKVWMARARNVSGLLSYSELTIAEAADVQLDSKYSETKVDKAANIRITSKCDEFTLGNVEELRLQTKYAVLRLNTARSAFITAQYSDVDITTVRQALDADICYGSLDVTTMSRNFSDANIVAKFTPVVIGMERGCAFNLDAEAQDADVHYPASVTVRTRSDSGSREVVNGYQGDPNAKGKVKARLVSGDIIIK